MNTALISSKMAAAMTTARRLISGGLGHVVNYARRLAGATSVPRKIRVRVKPNTTGRPSEELARARSVIEQKQRIFEAARRIPASFSAINE
jgi:hypothetical protein